ncbi:MAG TPA: J domain-containing protein, partial [Candidatus Limnocylindrales bacterium]|nr:J domain-containing protein [Candidatus Limnocylindrales bacterium]
MPARPEPILDPYRTLGLEAGASSAEVKRAYRRLAKTFHPDSAGEQAVPRFLAIQAAYDQIR